jgi:hypothetical protein
MLAVTLSLAFGAKNAASAWDGETVGIVGPDGPFSGP